MRVSIRRFLWLVPLYLWISLTIARPVRAQIGTQHGVLVTATASTSVVAGYNIYRCACAVGTTPDWMNAKPLNPTLLPSPLYLDGSVAVSTNYQYVMTAVDAKGSESPASNIATDRTRIRASWASANPVRANVSGFRTDGQYSDVCDKCERGFESFERHGN